jgi:hypothetical protein
MGIGYMDSCRDLFKEEKILTLPSQYIFSLLLFVTRNTSLFALNSVYHDINTTQKNDLHVPHARWTKYQKGVLYSGIKVFNALTTSIKTILNNPKKFKTTLKRYLLSHSFYSLNEFFSELKS